MRPFEDYVAISEKALDKYREAIEKAKAIASSFPPLLQQDGECERQLCTQCSVAVRATQKGHARQVCVTTDDGETYTYYVFDQGVPVLVPALFMHRMVDCTDFATLKPIIEADREVWSALLEHGPTLKYDVGNGYNNSTLLANVLSSRVERFLHYDLASGDCDDGVIGDVCPLLEFLFRSFKKEMAVQMRADTFEYEFWASGEHVERTTDSYRCNHVLDILLHMMQTIPSFTVVECAEIIDSILVGIAEEEPESLRELFSGFLVDYVNRFGHHWRDSKYEVDEKHDRAFMHTLMQLLFIECGIAQEGLDWMLELGSYCETNDDMDDLDEITGDRTLTSEETANCVRILLQTRPNDETRTRIRRPILDIMISRGLDRMLRPLALVFPNLYTNDREDIVKTAMATIYRPMGEGYKSTILDDILRHNPDGADDSQIFWGAILDCMDTSFSFVLNREGKFSRFFKLNDIGPGDRILRWLKRRLPEIPRDCVCRARVLWHQLQQYISINAMDDEITADLTKPTASEYVSELKRLLQYIILDGKEDGGALPLPTPPTVETDRPCLWYDSGRDYQHSKAPHSALYAFVSTGEMLIGVDDLHSTLVDQLKNNRDRYKAVLGDAFDWQGFDDWFKTSIYLNNANEDFYRLQLQLIADAKKVRLEVLEDGTGAPEPPKEVFEPHGSDSTDVARLCFHRVSGVDGRFYRRPENFSGPVEPPAKRTKM